MKAASVQDDQQSDVPSPRHSVLLVRPGLDVIFPGQGNSALHWWVSVHPVLQRRESSSLETPRRALPWRTCEGARPLWRRVTHRVGRLRTKNHRLALHRVQGNLASIVYRVQFSSRWCLCAQKSLYALHHISQKFPRRRVCNGSNVRLIDNGPLSSFQWRSSSASLFHVYRDDSLQPLVLPALQVRGQGAVTQDDNARPHPARVVNDSSGSSKSPGRTGQHVHLISIP